MLFFPQTSNFWIEVGNLDHIFCPLICHALFRGRAAGPTSPAPHRVPRAARLAYSPRRAGHCRHCRASLGHRRRPGLADAAASWRVRHVHRGEEPARGRAHDSGGEPARGTPTRGRLHGCLQPLRQHSPNHRSLIPHDPQGPSERRGTGGRSGGAHGCFECLRIRQPRQHPVRAAALGEHNGQRLLLAVSRPRCGGRLQRRRVLVKKRHFCANF